MSLSATSRSLLILFCLGLSLSALHAAVTPEQRKEIAELKKDLGKVQAHITKKEPDEAEKLLNDVEQKLRAIVTAASIMETDKAVAPLFKQIELKKLALNRKKGGPAGTSGISFVGEVAPILTANCVRCHANGNAKGGLRLDTFAGLEQGGSSGPLAIAKNANSSLIMERLIATDDSRMPKGGAPLKQVDVQKIAQWINDGVKFDGSDKSTILATVAKAVDGKAAAPVKIEKATGNEKVSFVNDIAPFMSNLCVNCHSGVNPRAGFSLETFEALMRGGKNGPVILPGKPIEESRLWQLAGLQEPVKMPPGQSLLTRTNHSNLKTWLEEGAKFDGANPKATIRSLVPTEAERRAKEMASLSPGELIKRRKDQSTSQWTTAMGDQKPVQVEDQDFLLFGNVEGARLREILEWAAEDAKTLRKVFGIKPDDTIWRGKLAIFVFKDRLDYAEFTRTIEMLEIPNEATGHSKVTAGGDEAYICVQDIGDEERDDSPGLRVTLYGHLTGAILQRSTKKVPDWVVRGTGLALAARSNPKSTYFKRLPGEAAGALKVIGDPAEVFADGTFSATDIGPVGFTLVEYLLKQGQPQFVQFLNLLQINGDFGGSLKTVYGTDPPTLAAAYLGSFTATKGPAKKKKR